MTAYLGWSSPRERGRLARILIPAKSLPSTATPSQSAPNPPLRGSLRLCQALCGRDARAPRWFFGESLAIRYANGRNDHQIDLLAGRRIRARAGGVGTPLGRCRSPKCCGGPLFLERIAYIDRLPWLVIPRERGRLARILIPAKSLPATATPSQSAPNPPLRGSLPSCQALCGRDARAPGGFFGESLAIRYANGRNDHQIDLLAGRRIRARAGGVGTPLGGAEVRSVAAGPCFWNELPTLTAYLGWSSPRERGRLARILIPAKSLPSTATPSQSAPNPPLRGSLPSCQALCGRDARAPGWFFGESLAIRYANGRNDHQIDLLAGRRIRARAGGVGTPLGGAEVRSVAAGPCFWNESPTLTAYLGWSSPGSAGVSPASLFLQTASQPRPLPRKVHQTRLYGILFACARLCAGETPAFPGGFLARVWPYAMLMAVTTIKSTYLLDVESVRALEELARHWEVPKSEVLRRAPVSGTNCLH